MTHIRRFIPRRRSCLLWSCTNTKSDMRKLLQSSFIHSAVVTKHNVRFSTDWPLLAWITFHPLVTLSQRLLGTIPLTLGNTNPERRVPIYWSTWDIRLIYTHQHQQAKFIYVVPWTATVCPEVQRRTTQNESMFGHLCAFRKQCLVLRNVLGLVRWEIPE